MKPNASSSSLSSRLIPENGLTNKPNSGATLKPKILSQSKSTPAIAGASGEFKPAGTMTTSKVERLRMETTNGAFHDVNEKITNKSLSNSHSAAVLSGKVSSQYEFSRTDPFGNKLYVDTEPITGYNRTNTGTYLANKRAELHESDFRKNDFLRSLMLSEKQYHDLEKVPHTFFYMAAIQEGQLRPGTSSTNDILVDRGSNGSVYDLQIVSLDQVDKNYYFTLSKEGVTQFRNKVSHFTGLVQWDREYRLFHKIANIHFFKVYKRWKVQIPLTF